MRQKCYFRGTLGDSSGIGSSNNNHNPIAGTDNPVGSAGRDTRDGGNLTGSGSGSGATDAHGDRNHDGPCLGHSSDVCHEKK